MREMGSRPLKSKLLEQARALMRVKHRSIRTEAAYLGWMERFLRFHRDRAGRWVHPAEMENSHVETLLTYLAVAGKVAASTQNQASTALLFLFREVLKRPLQVNAMRVKTPRHVPIVLSIDEVRRLLDQLPAGSGGGRRKGVRTFFWGVELGEDAELGRPKHADEAGGLITP